MKFFSDRLPLGGVRTLFRRRSASSETGLFGPVPAGRAFVVPEEPEERAEPEEQEEPEERESWNAREDREAALSDEALRRIRRKYGLPPRFVLMAGPIEGRCNHRVVCDALQWLPADIGAVICGRRTPYADRLLAYVRERHLAVRVEFIYESTPADLRAFYRLAGAFVSMAEPASGLIVEHLLGAFGAQLPAVLSDLPRHRAVAGDAALYLRCGATEEEVAEAFDRLFEGENFRRDMRLRARRRAELLAAATAVCAAGMR